MDGQATLDIGVADCVSTFLWRGTAVRALQARATRHQGYHSAPTQQFELSVAGAAPVPPLLVSGVPRCVGTHRSPVLPARTSCLPAHAPLPANSLQPAAHGAANLIGNGRGWGVGVIHRQASTWPREKNPRPKQLCCFAANQRRCRLMDGRAGSHAASGASARSERERGRAGAAGEAGAAPTG